MVIFLITISYFPKEKISLHHKYFQHTHLDQLNKTKQNKTHKKKASVFFFQRYLNVIWFVNSRETYKFHSKPLTYLSFPNHEDVFLLKCYVLRFEIMFQKLWNVSFGYKYSYTFLKNRKSDIGLRQMSNTNRRGCWRLTWQVAQHHTAAHHYQMGGEFKH